jgi:hypothetical protein
MYGYNKNVTRLTTQGCNNIVTSWLYRTWRHYQTCYKVVLTSLIQSWYNKNVTRLTTQGCNNIVITWLYPTLLEQPPCNKSDNDVCDVTLSVHPHRASWQVSLATVGIEPATFGIIPTRLLQVVNSLFQTCWKLGTSSAQLVDGLLEDLLQNVTFLRVYPLWHQEISSKVFGFYSFRLDG